MAEDPGLLYESGERGLLFGLSHHVSRRDNVAEFVMRQTHAFLVLWGGGPSVGGAGLACGVSGGRSAACSSDAPLQASRSTAAHSLQARRPLNKQKKKGAGPDISVIISIFLFASQRRLERDLWYLGGLSGGAGHFHNP